MLNYFYPCKPFPISILTLKKISEDEMWVAEAKKNGKRCLVFKENGKVILWNRHRNQFRNMESMVVELENVPDGTVLDGEMILKGAGGEPQLFLFDLPILRYTPLFVHPLCKRRELLETLNLNSSHVSVLMQVKTNKLQFFYGLQKTDLQSEGIVLKRVDSEYVTGYVRSPKTAFWLKVKFPRN